MEDTLFFKFYFNFGKIYDRYINVIGDYVEK